MHVMQVLQWGVKSFVKKITLKVYCCYWFINWNRKLYRLLFKQTSIVIVLTNINPFHWGIIFIL